MMRVLTLFMIAAVLWGPQLLQAQHACDAARLDRAVGAYGTGAFSQTLDVLRPCLPEGFSSNVENVGAHKLMALTYIATDSLQQARSWVKRLVDLDPRHRANPQTEPPIFVEYVNDLRPRWYSWLWRGGEWYKWAGRGLIVAGAVALPIVLGRAAEPDLPPPPLFPTN